MSKQFGPNSGVANSTSPLRRDLFLWYKSRQEKFLPNNKIVSDLIALNKNIIPEEYSEIFESLLAHIFAFEKHCEDASFAKFLIQSIDDFCQCLDKPTVLVIDNAPTHRAKLFTEQLESWQEKGLYIFFLPKYSPHLNIAEIYWRKAKYEWLRPSDYFSFAKYKQKIKEIFNKIGIDYKIVFKELNL
jgi:hypothetical protein